MTLTLLASMLAAPLLAAEAAPAAAPAVLKKVDPSQIAALTLEPAAIVLDDPRSKQRIVVSAKVGDRLVDVTDQAAIVPSDPKVVALNDKFEAVPLADGAAELTVTVGPHVAKAPAKVSNFTKGRPINFPNEIVPIFTKLTCNSGGCHGKSGGQNGFRLSLLGFVPQEDHEYLVKESRGRRLFPASPDESLLLRKATGRAPHGGGKLMKVNDDNYQLVVAWMRQGMPYGSDNDAVVAKIEVQPAHRIMDRQTSQRLRVVAHYANGRAEDVTRFTQFSSNNTEVANVEDVGKVSTADLSGEAAIMARYLGQVAVFRASVPSGVAIVNPPKFDVRNYIDEHTSKKWRDLGLAPSPICDDYTFIRRLSIDLTGTLPEPAAVTAFAASTVPNKRELLIDEMLNSQKYASFMALKWGAVLQNKRAGAPDKIAATHAMSLWLKSAFQRDLPFDQFARAILTATGTPEENPPVVWYSSVRTPEENVDNISQLFLGTRVQCARCHHHPFEKWSQDDYYGMAAFFARLNRKNVDKLPSGQPREVVFVQRGGGVNHPRTGQSIKPHGLDASPIDVPAGDDPRRSLADWMTSPRNPFFARALTNRMWGHFFQRGIVEPIDDMRVTNPPSNPELLDALSADFVANGFSMKKLIKAICMSSTYQLSCEPTDYNVKDKQNFARYYPRRLPAEVLLDAVDLATGSFTNFGYPQDMRAVDLPDESAGSYFLDIFGRPQRTSSCECERTSEANLSQALHLLNSAEIQGKLTAGNARAAMLAADKRPDAEKVAELFLWFYSRPAKPDELKTAVEHIEAKKDNKAVAYQNIIWALLNTKEFLFSK